MRRVMTWQNIERYRTLLEKETDATRRKTLEKLLAEEERIWAGLTGFAPARQPLRRPA